MTKHLYAILALAAFLLLLTACDKNSIDKLARQERDKLELQVQKYLGPEYSIEEFRIENEGYENGKSRYVMDCVATLNQKPILLPTQEIPWRLVFEKPNKEWTCVESKPNINLPQLGDAGSHDSPSFQTENPFFGGLDPNATFSSLEDLINAFEPLNTDFNRTLLDLTALSTEEENQVGEQLQQQIVDEVGVTESRKYNIQAIFNKIRAHSSRPDLAWECTVTAIDEFNAFAVAGGKTFLNRGILDGLDSEGQVAFVIAHEIAHNDLKHCVEKIQYEVRAREIDPLLGDVVGVAYSIYSHPFSQEMEYAADRRGVELMQAAGWSKQGAIDFFLTLQEFEPTFEDPSLQAVNDFISTHPTAQKRIERVERM